MEDRGRGMDGTLLAGKRMSVQAWRGQDLGKKEPGAWPEWEDRTHVTDVSRGERGRWPKWGRGGNRSSEQALPPPLASSGKSAAPTRGAPGAAGLCGESWVSTQSVPWEFSGEPGPRAPRGPLDWRGSGSGAARGEAAPSGTRRREIMTGSCLQDGGRGRKLGG